MIAATISFFFLFFLQNVFQQQVFKEVRYQLSDAVLTHLTDAGIATRAFEELRGQQIVSAIAFSDALRARGELSESEEDLVIASAEVYPMTVTRAEFAGLDRDYLEPERAKAVEALIGRSFVHKWQLKEALTALSDTWKAKDAGPLTKDYNEQLRERYDYLFRPLHTDKE